MKWFIFISYLQFMKVAFSELADVDIKYDCFYCQPEQVHIAFGDNPNDIVVTWSTFNSTDESTVEYGVGTMNQKAVGYSDLFIDGGSEQREQWIHRVVLKNLKFDTHYVYHAGSKYGWSDELTFKTPPAGEDWTLRAALYGDMGVINAHSMSYLQDEAQRGHFDVILHVGDFAYDMDTDQALVGDQFMRQLQPLAGNVPYMTCPGNHEEAYNFSNYKHRFSMPGDSQSMYYSFNLGPVHFVSISTEFYYFLNYGLKMVVNQYYWLVEDLKEANKPENREKRPWIILYGHRPMYCSNNDDIDCGFERTRIGLFCLFSLEPLLKDYGVDMVIWAHEHSYERTWPLFNEKVYNGSIDKPYVNPGAPVHVITGSAGCQEGTDGFKRPANPWSAYRSVDYGYSRINVTKTSIRLEQISVDKNGKVIDSFELIKDRHGPYDNIKDEGLCH